VFITSLSIFKVQNKSLTAGVGGGSNTPTPNQEPEEGRMNSSTLLDFGM